MSGWLNPKDLTNSVSARPAHVSTGAGARRWFSDDSGTLISGQDLNAILGALRSVVDRFGIAEVEGSDGMLRDGILAGVEELRAEGRSYVYAAPSSGGTVTLTDGRPVLLDPAGTLATLHVVLPAGQPNGTRIRVTSSREITALSFSAADAATVDGSDFFWRATGT